MDRLYHLAWSRPGLKTSRLGYLVSLSWAHTWTGLTCMNKLHQQTYFRQHTNCFLHQRNRYRLDDSRTSMPALAHPRTCTSGVGTSKQAAHVFKLALWICKHLKMCGCKSNPHTLPEPCGCKSCYSGPFNFNIGPWGPYPSTYGYVYYCGCVDDQYLLQYWTRAKRLPRLLKKAGRFLFK